MKKKILSFVLAICFIFPAVMLFGCGKSKNPYAGYKQINGYYLKCEQSSYTGQSVQLVMSIKNDKDFEIKLEPSVFILKGAEYQYSFTNLSVYQEGNWNITAARVSADAGETVTFRLTFRGAGLEDSYKLYYQNTEIATVSQNSFSFI